MVLVFGKCKSIHGKAYYCEIGFTCQTTEIVLWLASQQIFYLIESIVLNPNPGQKTRKREANFFFFFLDLAEIAACPHSCFLFIHSYDNCKSHMQYLIRIRSQSNVMRNSCLMLLVLFRTFDDTCLIANRHLMLMLLSCNISKSVMDVLCFHYKIIRRESEFGDIFRRVN